MFYVLIKLCQIVTYFFIKADKARLLPPPCCFIELIYSFKVDASVSTSMSPVSDKCSGNYAAELHTRPDIVIVYSLVTIFVVISAM